MRKNVDQEEGTVSVPVDWTGDVEIDRTTDDIYTVRRVRDDGSTPPLSINATNRPILVDVHFGRSAVVATPQDAVRFGYRESDFRTEFYYLDILEEPKWVQITEETDDPPVGVYQNVDCWISKGQLTKAEGEWAKDQFE